MPSTERRDAVAGKPGRRRAGAWGAGIVAGAGVLLLAGAVLIVGGGPRGVPAPAAGMALPLGARDACQRYSGLPEGFGVDPRAGMVDIPAGEYEPGNADGYPDERPAGKVRVASFWMDRTEVTNAQFAAFVDATAYRTWAEREGGGAVFAQPAQRGAAPGAWWTFVSGADWRHPEGPGSDLRGRDNQPVVQVALEDARAYARWLGRELPTEDEWEWAARAGGAGERLEREPRDAQGVPVANYWQGVFPDVNAVEDGYAGRAPVGCYPANGWQLYDMIGNVWEWTADPYVGARRPRPAPGSVARQEAGDALPGGTPYVIKGGSFLCAAGYCRRYRSTARHPLEDNLPTSHAGFRTVLRPR